MSTADKGAKKRYKANKTLVNVVEWEGAFRPEAMLGMQYQLVIIILPRQEKNFEVEMTYNTTRVVVFINYAQCMCMGNAMSTAPGHPFPLASRVLMVPLACSLH